MILKYFIVAALSYLIGSIPFGWLVVMIARGRDVRTLGSGRVGGTNVMRAAGCLAGVLTAFLDAFKGLLALWTANWLLPGHPWAQALGPLMAVVGQVLSVFLVERQADGKLLLRGGAGGATTFGGLVALWPPALLVIWPLAGLVFILGGYASLTTIAVALSGLLALTYLAVTGAGPWEHVLYGVGTLALVLWALRTNLQRVRAGTERVVGLRAWRQKQQRK
ncbi:MAG TPA: glycerol-3-phosphate acyltransferase [Anaerolineaceae bacterium]|jgi:glycerol-3-phosphate acyltransferase PlsY|nr:glycerol-3-phosphate acyltransferase [Anaerolineaceae bacterium]